MDTSSASVPAARELLTVELHGLKPALLERARSNGVSISAFVRTALTDALGASGGLHGRDRAACAVQGARQTRITMRLPWEDAIELVARARTAGLPVGLYVAVLMRSTIEPASASDRAACTASLIRSNAELSALARNIGHLTALLRQGSVRAAQEYRETLDALNADVRAHLAVAAAVLSEVRSRQPACTRTEVPR